jgi:DNA-binding transcriptional ArsR family regulator
MNSPFEHADPFAALSDPTRRAIVERLATTGPQRVADIADGFDISRQAVTKHLDILSGAGMVHSERRGRERFSQLADNAFDPILAWLKRYDRFWDDRLAELKRLVEEGETS